MGPGAEKSRFQNFCFDGQCKSYALWRKKFSGYLCNDKPDLFSVVDETLKEDADNATKAKYEKDSRKLYYELVLVLDDKKNEKIGDNYENDGRALMQYLEQKFHGSNTPALLSYYHEWTSLKMDADEAIVDDYIARAESALEELKNHLEKHEKTLNNFNKNPDIEEPGAVANLMRTVKRKVPKCYGCGEKGHKKNECMLAGNLYCTTSNKSGHNNKACRAKGKKKDEMNGAVSMIEINDTKCCK